MTGLYYRPRTWAERGTYERTQTGTLLSFNVIPADTLETGRLLLFPGRMPRVFSGRGFQIYATPDTGMWGHERGMALLATSKQQIPGLYKCEAISGCACMLETAQPELFRFKAKYVEHSPTFPQAVEQAGPTPG